MPGYYEWREDLWESIPGVDYLERDEFQEASTLFTLVLHDVEFGHMRPQESDYWQDFLDFFGIDNDGDAWDWDDFRDWYDST
jgi:hypothetical protein